MTMTMRPPVLPIDAAFPKSRKLPVLGLILAGLFGILTVGLLQIMFRGWGFAVLAEPSAAVTAVLSVGAVVALTWGSLRSLLDTRSPLIVSSEGLRIRNRPMVPWERVDTIDLNRVHAGNGPRWGIRVHVGGKIQEINASHTSANPDDILAAIDAALASRGLVRGPEDKQFQVLLTRHRFPILRG